MLIFGDLLEAQIEKVTALPTDGKEYRVVAYDSDLYFHDGNKYTKFTNYNDVVLNNAHRISSGIDHEYIDQDLTIDASVKHVSGFFGPSGDTKESCAILEAKSTTQGYLLPRMTTAQRLAISTPVAGLKLFDTDEDAEYYYSSSGWVKLIEAASGALPVIESGDSEKTVSVKSDESSYELVEKVSGYETGDLKFQSHSTIPTGFINCDGSLLSRTTYSALFAVIGETFGSGDGSTTFAIPDLRAASLRGVGTSTQFTQNVTVTLAQIINDMIQGHYHESYLQTQFTSGSTASGVRPWGSGSLSDSIRDPSTDGTNGTPRTGNETTGKAVGVYILIKY